MSSADESPTAFQAWAEHCAFIASKRLSSTTNTYIDIFPHSDYVNASERDLSVLYFLVTVLQNQYRTDDVRHQCRMLPMVIMLAKGIIKSDARSVTLENAWGILELCKKVLSEKW
jgi:hypothetical protein